MSEEKASIFRPKTLEAVSSPEVLDNYLRVTSPGVWIFLAAVICLLAGVIVWSIFGSIQSTAELAVISDGSVSYCVVPYEKADSILAAGEITVEDETILMFTANYQQGVLDDSTDPRVLIVGSFAAGDYVLYVPLVESVAQAGVFSGTVVTETLRPISLLLQ